MGMDAFDLMIASLNIAIGFESSKNSFNFSVLGTYFWIFMYSVYEAVKKLSEQLTQSTRRDDFADTTKFVV